jgi:hypothetical protein
VNAHRKKTPDMRAQLDVLTKEAEGLIVGMNAVVISTTTLFEIWELSKNDRPSAQRRIEDLYEAAPGIFK